MRIGMSPATRQPSDGSGTVLFANLRAQVELMAELGFASVSVGDHHISRDHALQGLPLICRLSAYSGEMQLIPLFLLPLYHPILLAEQIATLDVMSGGRTAMICCLGNQRAAHEAFQSPQSVRVSRFVEAFEVVKLLCAGDDVSYHGTQFSFEGVSINPKPLQQPMPMWIGSSADPAIRRAARMADAWVISPGWTPTHIENKLRVYRSALEEYGRGDEVTEVVLRRDIHLGATSSAARQDTQALFDNGYRGFSPDELRESLIVGTPDECIGYLESMRSLGITQVLFRAAASDQRLAMQTTQLLGTEVIPNFS